VISMWKRSGALLSTMRTLVGAEGGVTSLVASVVSVTALLVAVLPLWSCACTVNVYDVAGVRCRRTTETSLYQFTCSVTRVPLAKMRYPTNHARSSVDRVHVRETCEGPRTIPESCGAVGGVVSRGVVTSRVLLCPDSLSALSTAVT
jgi:hypothetical protein